ncbi:alpha,alpha-phosphotrehalase [Enterococcus sp. 10A9_DIV0425]|uniref:Alpha,alpha-phosphotrehalase n=1 Tax=Candidatus Enterococcus wittei TaxID=1987383 RepID=A0A242K0T0_9ENTE|nr:alpha,alpha-phosphotrehalase [Enterococcus sp. 10A9_DIV0425]OTP11267.1 alpha,alpha-phosphotrehalase [Enterococcus sp. 10A9_DIV0425]THE09052.1 alpha,alpha-phosphotrehalase [Enterococcus hirae]
MAFKEKVIYQIYPKSFRDSNGDGVGDLPGIKEKLPYLHDLGVDMIWLNPFYPSPQKDNGYDISDYIAIDPRFGTMKDFEELVAEAQKYNIELMLDMVLNHVSIEHEWFQKALAGDKYYQDFFILRDEPTDWVSKFGGNAWAPFGDTGKYYLHLYDKTQADLNWRNEAVQQELFKVVRFWMDKGVKGFRFDVINVIGKDEELKNNAINEGKAEYTDKPITHTYLQRLNKETFGQDPEIITVGEMSSTTIENCILYTAPERHELSMVFNFHHLKVDYENGYKWTTPAFDFEELKRLFHTWGEEMSVGNGWNALFLNNHDQPRALNRFVEIGSYRKQGAMMLATMIHLNRGTPYIYMGEEIGMIDPDFTSISEYKDVESLNAYQLLQEQGLSPEEAFRRIKAKSRDNSRTPMQWTKEAQSGFTSGKPWLTLAANHEEINVENELMQEDSILAYYKKLIQLRKNYPIVALGDYHAYQPEHPQVYAYMRQLDKQKLLVFTNFYASETTIDLPEEFLEAEVLIDNYSSTNIQKTLKLQPYQSLGLLLN